MNSLFSSRTGNLVAQIVSQTSSGEAAAVCSGGQRIYMLHVFRYLNDRTYHSSSFRRRTNKIPAMDPRANPADEPAALFLKRLTTPVGVGVGIGKVGVANGVGDGVGVNVGVGVGVGVGVNFSCSRRKRLPSCASSGAAFAGPCVPIKANTVTRKQAAIRRARCGRLFMSIKYTLMSSLHTL